VNVVQAFVSIFLLIMVSGAFFVWRKKYPFLLIGWLWFLGMLVPMIGLVQVGAQSHADRYTYLPQIGLFLLMVWGGATWAAEWRLPRELPAGVALVTVAAFAVVSYNETTYWQNSETLWHHALADTVRNHIAESKLGDALLMQDRFQEAKEHYQNALEIFPQYASVANNLGYVLWKEGKRSEAIVLYQKALQFSPEMASAHTNLGVALRDAGNATEAVKHYREALRTNPGNVEARYNLADALVDLGQRDEALVQLREAFRLAPNNEDVRTRLRALGAP